MTLTLTPAPTLTSAPTLSLILTLVRAGAVAVALVSAVLLFSVGRWLGEQTGVFGASLDPAYWDEAPAKVTLRNLLD